ncbi:hypothetical protein AwErysi_05860 [Erysipelotrichaceae bacterium]|nr:hypothetical protein AwErysi_05860 [Erysipelotrichaceae bacterium]
MKKQMQQLTQAPTMLLLYGMTFDLILAVVIDDNGNVSTTKRLSVADDFYLER